MEQVEKWTRGYLFLMLASVFATTSPHIVPASYFIFLEDLSKVGNYSWGSAILAHLYEQLCAASESGVKTISGPLSLLQIWAWSRIPAVRPQILREPMADVPYGGRYHPIF